MSVKPITHETVTSWLNPRPADCHKGDFGAVGILGGAPGMIGAALLAGRAALWVGAGRVYVAALDTRLGLDPMTPELMIGTPQNVLELTGKGCLVVGPGLGQSNQARELLLQTLGTALPLILDADALNLLACDADILAAFTARTRKRPDQTLLTPHPGEAGRLLRTSNDAVQADRTRALQQLIQRYACGVVLKGHGSLIGFPSQGTNPGACWLNSTGNPGMAAPGMGDALAGILGALAAQGLSLEQAAITGVYLHGAAAESAVKAGSGPVGLCASEVIFHARKVFNAWLNQSA